MAYKTYGEPEPPASSTVTPQTPWAPTSKTVPQQTSPWTFTPAPPSTQQPVAQQGGTDARSQMLSSLAAGNQPSDFQRQWMRVLGISEQDVLNAQHQLGGPPGGYAQNPWDVPRNEQGQPMRPPSDPRESLTYQFSEGQRTENMNIEALNKSMELYQEAIQEMRNQMASNQETMNTAREEQAAAVAETRARDQAMMEQRQAALRAALGLGRQSSPGSLAQMQSGLYSELGQSYDWGRYQTPDILAGYTPLLVDPVAAGGFAAQAGAQMGSTSFTPPDYSAWTDQEAYRSQWTIPGVNGPLTQGQIGLTPTVRPEQRYEYRSQGQPGGAWW
uniref:Uncharacterized protein n=1 Tax=viral metagenome TaxID=1070528 RepID=A0A6M3XVK5_9ZZZZ